MNITETTLVFKISDNNDLFDFTVPDKIKHFIADLRGVSIEITEEIKDKFITFDQSISRMDGSFVVVCDFSFDERLIIVPTLQEAYDYIEMEEIERQLK